MLADILGMTWWTVLMAGGGFVVGIFLSSHIKSILKK
tara:strand:+ start:259 stop:369 length:111 start_codon:yes stop_codon:yes gene_type:complete